MGNYGSKLHGYLGTKKCLKAKWSIHTKFKGIYATFSKNILYNILYRKGLIEIKNLIHILIYSDFQGRMRGSTVSMRPSSSLEIKKISEAAKAKKGKKYLK